MILGLFLKILLGLLMVYGYVGKIPYILEMHIDIFRGEMFHNVCHILKSTSA